MRSPKALLNCPLLSSSREPSKPFKIRAMDFYLHYNYMEYLHIHQTQLGEHFAQTASTVGSTAPHNPHPVAEQALMTTVIDVDHRCYTHAYAQILSVAVVEFGTHTPRYWSETYQGVSMDCWKICHINCFWSNTVNFSGDTVVGYHCW